MNILLIGDIIGNSGVKKVKEGIEEIKKKHQIDFIIANGENAGERNRNNSAVILKT